MNIVLQQKALSLREDFSKVSPEIRDTQPFTGSKDVYTDCGIGLD